MVTPDVFLFQIAYDEATRQKVAASGFQLMDNTDNERPDWYEYWPIRRYLLSHTLRDDAWYGFFSPKFSEKTQLDYLATFNFINSASAQADVVLFSPQPDMGANFLSVFEQAEVFDPGFIQTAKEFLATRNLNVPLESMVMDSRQTVYSNYFVAKPPFWRDWFALAEALFNIAEDKTNPLSAALCYQTNYAQEAQRKVFLLERLASLILVMRPDYKVAACNPYNFGWSMAKFRNSPEDTYINDALKRAFRDTGYPQYMDAYRKMREKLTN